MMKVALYLAVCLACCLLGTEGLSCIPGGRGCTPERIASLQCPYGTVVTACRGCACGKGLGEGCGGPWQMIGQCASGLTCKGDNDGNFHVLGKCVKDVVEEEKK
ncbi:venom protein 302-like [Penaeus indicus]|uniref:venom protein 302-like n=1 Tax=Penaeus indicus TaxID=29960 RepID=UPI00300D8636